MRAVLFDFDGTLTAPGALDLKTVRQVLGVPQGTLILDYIQAMGDPGARREAMRTLERIEIAGAANAVPNAGAEDLVKLLAVRGIRRGILTNNCRASLVEAMKAFSRIGLVDFDVVLHRENAPRHKPYPDGIRHAAGLLGIAASELLVVGDYVFDMEAGSRAGAVTAFLTNGEEVPAMSVKPDHVIATLVEVRSILGI